MKYFFPAFLNTSSATSDLSITLGSSALLDSNSGVNKTQDVTISTTLFDGLQPLQEIVTPSPVEMATSEELLEEEVAATNETEGTGKLKDDVELITELKEDIPTVDKFVRAGRT